MVWPNGRTGDDSRHCTFGTLKIAKSCCFILLIPYFLIINLAVVHYFFDLSKLHDHFASLVLDRIKQQPVQYSINSSFQTTPYVTPPKIILLWTTYFGDRKWGEMFDLNEGSDIVTFTGPIYDPDDTNTDGRFTCRMAYDRSLVKTASAVVFHTRDFGGHDFPSTRYDWQRWVMYGLESPIHNGLDQNRYQAANKAGFNWLMNYRLSADVYYPYGSVDKMREELVETNRKAIADKIEHFIEGFANRSFDGYWMVSNCGSQSRRAEMCQSLVNAGFKIERWGGCGADSDHKSPDSKWRSRENVANFFAKYRFYLSFENSLCDDYITEKAFGGYYHNYNHGLIPIVYGAGNYSRILPRGSFIDATRMKFDDLVSLLRNLSSYENRKQLEKYYEWQFTHEMATKELPNTHYFQRNYGLKFGWKTLCRKLWTTPDHELKTITDMQSRMGNCYQSPESVPR